MKARELNNLGIPKGPTLKLALRLVGEVARSGVDKASLREEMKQLTQSPEDFIEHEVYAPLAQAIVKVQADRARFEAREEPAPYRQWGTDLEEQAIQQMRNACDLPVAVRGALMPDAHLGYGLPIGGVLATRNAVIPYAVGVDIACRMKMTVLDIPVEQLDKRQERFRSAIDRETRFGIGAKFKRRRDHDVLSEDWSVSSVTAEVKDRAWSQLGTSGSGNHFVEFGILEVKDDELGLPAGNHLAFLSHSGSRGAGAAVAGHYSSLAMELRPELPNELRHLAWLDLDSEPGQEYWHAMELMGKYAAANHACIHQHVAQALGAEVLLDLENHHNFAWKEEHDGEEVIVHRKGATPAGEGVLGIIPGSMASPTYIARGKGSVESLHSASHGAGRVMSRKKAKAKYKWSDVNQYLADRDVTLMSAGLDEVPMVYKDIDKVMDAQSDLVDRVARFTPRLVKMAPAGERPED